ncbi:hypothetical protein [Streptomyces sp. NPDC051677]|uniref:hypothetical protein n=1 Tax=Streptomyces sp. NPDC051677 TaxID=3365669 RepID=UPI0037D26D54
MELHAEGVQIVHVKMAHARPVFVRKTRVDKPVDVSRFTSQHLLRDGLRLILAGIFGGNELDRIRHFFPGRIQGYSLAWHSPSFQAK